MTMRNEELRFEDDAAARLAHLERYWRSLVRRGLPPGRHEIEPRRIGAALPGAFVLDRIAPGQARLRVAGQALCDLVGGEARGLPLSRLFALRARPRLAALIEQGFERQWPCHAPLRRDGGHRVVGGMVLLPLLARPGGPRQMIGAVLHDLPARPGLRFDFAGSARIGAPAQAAGRLRLVAMTDAPLS